MRRGRLKIEGSLKESEGQELIDSRASQELEVG